MRSLEELEKSSATGGGEQKQKQMQNSSGSGQGQSASGGSGGGGKGGGKGKAAVSKGIKIAGDQAKKANNSLQGAVNSTAGDIGGGGEGTEDIADSATSGVDGVMGQAKGIANRAGGAVKRKGSEMMQKKMLAKSSDQMARLAGFSDSEIAAQSPSNAVQAAKEGGKKLSKKAIKAALKKMLAAIKKAVISAVKAIIAFVVAHLALLLVVVAAVAVVWFLVAWFLGMADANDNRNADFLGDFYNRGNSRYNEEIENTWVGVYFMKYSANSIYATVTEPEGNDEEYSNMSFNDMTGRDKVKNYAGEEASGDKESRLYQQGTATWADLDVAEIQGMDEQLRVSAGALSVLSGALNDGYAIPEQLIKPVYTGNADKLGTDEFKISEAKLKDDDGKLYLESAQSTKIEESEEGDSSVTISETEKEDGQWDWGLGTYVHYKGFYQPSQISGYHMETIQVLSLPSNLDITGAPPSSIGTIVNFSMPSSDDLNKIVDSYGGAADDGTSSLVIPEGTINYKDWKPAFDAYNSGSATADQLKYAPYNSTGVPVTEVKYLVDEATTFAGQIDNELTQTWVKQGDTEGAQAYSADTYVKPEEYPASAKITEGNTVPAGAGVASYKNIYKKGERMTIEGTTDFDPAATFQWEPRKEEETVYYSSFGEAMGENYEGPMYLGPDPRLDEDEPNREYVWYIYQNGEPCVIASAATVGANDPIPNVENYPELIKEVKPAVGAHYWTAFVPGYEHYDIWEDPDDTTKDANKDDYSFGGHYRAEHMTTYEKGTLQTYMPTYQNADSAYEGLDNDYLEYYISNYQVYYTPEKSDLTVEDLDWRQVGSDKLQGIIDGDTVRYDKAAEIEGINKEHQNDSSLGTINGENEFFSNSDVGRSHAYDWGICYFKDNASFNNFYFNRMPNLQFYYVAGRLGYISEQATEELGRLETPTRSEDLVLQSIIGSNTENDIYKTGYTAYSQLVSKYCTMYGVDPQMIRMIMATDAPDLPEDQNPYADGNDATKAYPVTLVPKGNYMGYNLTYRAMAQLGNGASESSSSATGGAVSNIGADGTEQYAYEAGTAIDQLEVGETINVPSTVVEYAGARARIGSAISFTNWTTFDFNADSNQAALVNTYGKQHDEDGVGVINGRKTIAMTQMFGDVGDMVDITFDSGEIMRAIIVDIKSSGDAGWTVWGHNNGQCVVELYTNWDSNQSLAYKTEKGYDRVKTVTNRGSVYGTDGASDDSSGGEVAPSVLPGAEASIKATCMNIQSLMNETNGNVPMALLLYHFQAIDEKYGWQDTQNLGRTYRDGLLKFVEIAEGKDASVAKEDPTYNDWLYYIDYTNEHLDEIGITVDKLTNRGDLSVDTFKQVISEASEYPIRALANFQGSSIKQIVTQTQNGSTERTFRYWYTSDFRSNDVVTDTSEGMHNMSKITAAYNRVTKLDGSVGTSVWDALTMGRTSVNSGVYVNDEGKYDVKSSYTTKSVFHEPHLSSEQVLETEKKMLTMGTTENFQMMDVEDPQFWTSRLGSLFGDRAGGTGMTSLFDYNNLFGVGKSELESVFNGGTYSVVERFGTHVNKNGVVVNNDYLTIQSSAKEKTEVNAIYDATVTSVMKGSDNKGTITITLDVPSGKDIKVTFYEVQTKDEGTGDPNPFTELYDAYHSEDETEREKLKIKAGDAVGWTQDDGTVKISIEADGAFLNYLDIDNSLTLNDGGTTFSGSLANWVPHYDENAPYIKDLMSFGYGSLLTPWTNCTTVMCIMAYEIFGVELPFNLGNACTWYERLEAQGYSVGQTPEIGAIICWGPGSGFQYAECGHVAMVIDILPDGSIVVGEGGVGYGGYHTQVYSNWTVNDGGQPFIGFIYLQDRATKDWQSEFGISSVSGATEEKIALGQDIVAYGMQFVGCPYVWGGNGPAVFDCTGLTKYVYGHFGIVLPRVSDDQEKCGTIVPLSQAIPGDLITWTGHAGIYIGNNMVLNAMDPSLGVRTCPLSWITNGNMMIHRIF